MIISMEKLKKLEEEENRFNATSPTKNLICGNPGLNPYLRDKRGVPNSLSYSTAFTFQIIFFFHTTVEIELLNTSQK
jgi:hypothetical protein